jgi:hypothetical protein
MTSYLSRSFLNGDGVTPTFAVPFGYLGRLHVHVYVAGVEVAFTWDNATLVRPAVIPPVGTGNVLVMRRTPNTAMLHTIQIGTILPADINVDAVQLLYIGQELKDDEVATLHAPFNEGGDLTLPVIAQRAGKLLAFDSAGLPIASNKTLAQIEAGVTGGIVNNFVASLAALRLITAAAAVTIGTIFMTGYSAPNDGGQGWWTWVASSATADNTGTTVNPTGNTGNGRWYRLYDGALHDLWFGVKGDASTDNSATLQLVEDQANALQRGIYYPATTASRRFATGVTTYAGIQHMGDGMSTAFALTGNLDGGGSTLNFTKTNGGQAFLFTTPVGSPNVAAPTWRDMNIFCSSGATGSIAIKLGAQAGGFTDDNTSQGAIYGAQIDRVGFALSGRGGSTACQWSKVFNSRIAGCFAVGGDYGLADLKGSDNIEILQNTAFGATINEIRTVTAGTFMNMTWIRDNVFTGMTTGASGHLDINSRIAYIEGNWFENSQASAYNIKLTAGITGYVRNNAMYDNTVTNWLVVNGTYDLLVITGNGPGYPGLTALFNGGTGHKYNYNSVARAIIEAHGNFTDAGIPFNSEADIQAYANDGPAYSGSVVWTFTPHKPGMGSTYPYYQTIGVTAGGFFAFPYAAAQGSRVNFMPQGGSRSLTGTYDVWVQATAGANGSTLSLIVGGVTYTQAVASAAVTWYKLVAGATFTAVTELSLYNQDVAIQSTISVAQILVVKT